MMEVYQAYTDYKGMMELTEQLISTVAQEVLGTTKINYQGQEIDLTPPWNRMTMVEAVEKYSGVNFNNINSDEEARNIAKEKKVHIEGNLTKGEVLNLMFEEFAEEHLVQPTFILDYPVEVCLEGLASRKGKTRPDMPWIERTDETDWEFLAFVKNYNSESRPKVLHLLDKYAGKEVYFFKSRSEVDEFLKRL